MADYSLLNLEARAAAAREAHRELLGKHEERYQERKGLRYVQGITPFGVCGMGRAGKDESAKYLCARVNAIYPQSLSYLVLPLVAHIAKTSEDEAFTERHSHRDFWINACHAIRGRDYTMLVRMGLAQGDVAVGIRGLEEIKEARDKETVKLLIWIDNLRVPADPTVEYGPEMCDLMVPNHGTLAELYQRLDRISPLIRR